MGAGMGEMEVGRSRARPRTPEVPLERRPGEEALASWRVVLGRRRVERLRVSRATGPEAMEPSAGGVSRGR